MPALHYWRYRTVAEAFTDLHNDVGATMFIRSKRILTALAAMSFALPILAERTKLKPDFNIFTVAQDVELGRKVSKEMEARMEILSNSTAASYLDGLGRRLASRAPDSGQYRFQFRLVNDKSINALGLPGGFLYVHRGTIEAAANEAQLASVIAHEIAHIVLRHGTHQISKAYVLQVPASALGGIGRTSVTAVLEKVDGGFAASSMVLRNTLEAENQADLMGAQIIYDAGYDPSASTRFFEKLAEETKGKAPSLNGHPDSSNRIENVRREIEKLDGGTSNAILDSSEFQNVKLLVRSLPEPRNSVVR
jgi:predicted Zn-dependent protease